MQVTMFNTLVSVLTLAVFTLAPSKSAACGTSTPCETANGEYFIGLPETSEEKMPAVMFIHGYGSSGQGIFRNPSLIDRFLSRGYAVIAPNGTQRDGLNGRSWSFHPEFPQKRNEIDFLREVHSAAVAEHGIDPDRFILSGFSIGGSLTSYMACATPETFSAYTPVGGSFWRPHPTSCAGPVKLLHTHGWTDGTVPLEGRVIRGDDIRDENAFAQGDVFHAMEIWRKTNQCYQSKADRFKTDGPFWRRQWDRCADGSALEFALFPGGHVIPDGWVDMTLDWFENL